MRKYGLSLATAAMIAVGGSALIGSVAQAAGGGAHPPQPDYSFTGIFGSFDRAELQRGLQVYTGVCAACHSLDLVRFRELEALGYSEDQIKAFAATYSIEDGPNEDGDMYDRPGEPKDPFPAPFPNVQAAAASNGGKAPPDLSLIVKNRAHGLGSIGLNFIDMLKGGEFATGTAYVTALLGHGYVEEPTVADKMNCLAPNSGESHEAYEARLEEFTVPAGASFNKWFPGCAIKMPNPLYEDAVEFVDGTPATPEQMAHDVSVFLTWASEPTLEARKETGIKALLFLIVFTGILIAVKRNIWRNVKKA